MFLAALTAFLVGAVFGGIVLFNNHERTFARLAAVDVRLGQQIYNESVSRKAKDILLEQQHAQLALDLDAETLIREAEYLYLLYAIGNETQTRIANELIIAWLIGNETAAREAVDVVFAMNITTLFDLVNITEAFQIFSQNKFMQLMANISFLDALLTNETEQRNASDVLLFAETAQQNQTLSYLDMTLIREIHNRTVFEDLLFETLAAINAMGFNTSKTVKSIDGQGPDTNGNVNIVSANARTVITTTPGSVVIDNKGIFTINSIAPSAGDIGFVAGTNVGIDTVGMPPNTWRVSYTGPPPIPPGFSTSMVTGVMVTPLVVPELTWTYFFTAMVPPGAGTWAVEIEATLTLQTASLGTYAVVQLAVLPGDGEGLCNIVLPEPGGCLTLVDSTYFPTLTPPATDVTLRTLYVAQGAHYSFFYASRLNGLTVFGVAYTITMTRLD